MSLTNSKTMYADVSKDNGFETRGYTFSEPLRLLFSLSFNLSHNSIFLLDTYTIYISSLTNLFFKNFFFEYDAFKGTEKKFLGFFSSICWIIKKEISLN